MISANRVFNVEDGAAAVDLLVSGRISDDNGGGRNIAKSSPGTLKLTHTNNQFNSLWVNAGTVQITTFGALGDNRFRLGRDATTCILEYLGTGSDESFNQRLEIGSNLAGQPGGATILNNRSAAMTFSAGTFNQPLGNADQDRTLTLGGSSSGGDNVISGIIKDNNNSATPTRVGVTKQGSNTWRLDGANTYTGELSGDITTLETGWSQASINAAANHTLTVSGNLINGSLDPANVKGGIVGGGLSWTLEFANGNTDLVLTVSSPAEGTVFMVR